jgi:hypothetical protein
MERIWHHNKPAKRGQPTKNHGPGKEGINQRGNKETNDNPEGAAKLHRGDWRICPWDHFKPYNPQSWALRKTGQKKSHCLKKKISKHVWCLPKGMWETPQTYGRRYSGQMRLKCSFLTIKENAMYGANPTPLITPKTSSHAVGMMRGLGNWSELKE